MWYKCKQSNIHHMVLYYIIMCVWTRTLNQAIITLFRFTHFLSQTWYFLTITSFSSLHFCHILISFYHYNNFSLNIFLSQGMAFSHLSKWIKSALSRITLNNEFILYALCMTRLLNILCVCAILIKSMCVIHRINKNVHAKLFKIMCATRVIKSRMKIFTILSTIFCYTKLMNSVYPTYVNSVRYTRD